ncbi:hypothetical protein EYF80_021274 [Liparis tanakae]|uniref:Uncharacterized protein n=1 Tax=Liparis tanakae TaxID=230148 RepID=A0A4Z2HRM2_9TELE|nr:hypothetical protein EYF80_021274 [Liparis tanakae]
MQPVYQVAVLWERLHIAVGSRSLEPTMGCLLRQEFLSQKFIFVIASHGSRELSAAGREEPGGCLSLSLRLRLRSSLRLRRGAACAPGGEQRPRQQVIKPKLRSPGPGFHADLFPGCSENRLQHHLPHPMFPLTSSQRSAGMEVNRSDFVARLFAKERDRGGGGRGSNRESIEDGLGQAGGPMGCAAAQNKRKEPTGEWVEKCFGWAGDERTDKRPELGM